MVDYIYIILTYYTSYDLIIIFQWRRERTRPKVVMSPEEIEHTVLLQKEWTRYKKTQFMNNVRTIDRIMASQNRALQALKRESEELYEAAIEVRNPITQYNNIDLLIWLLQCLKSFSWIQASYRVKLRELSPHPHHTNTILPMENISIYPGSGRIENNRFI